jgi:hypothetical protein
LHEQVIGLDYVEKGFAEQGEALKHELARASPPISDAIDEFEGWLHFCRRFRHDKIPAKSQTPSSREIPESKHQTPSSKHQGNPKIQAPNHGPRFELGTWSFSGVWSLGHRKSNAEVSRLTGRSRSAVNWQRQQLRIGNPAPENRVWTAKEIALLGTESDQALAGKLGRGVLGVRGKRRQLRIRLQGSGS